MILTIRGAEAMRKKPPCKKDGVDCPGRYPGCQDHCGRLAEWKAGIDSENQERARHKETEWLMLSERALNGKIKKLKTTSPWYPTEHYLIKKETDRYWYTIEGEGEA